MMTSSPVLKDKVAVVTGSSRGIGRAIAQAFAREGAAVVICGRKQETLDQVAAEIGGTVYPVACHVGRADQIQRLVETAGSRFGKIDILVNNAATNPQFGGIANLEERAWDAIMNTNVKSCFFLSKMVREVMLAQGDGGAIINVSSTGGLRASGGLGGYSVSKAAVIMLTQVCAKEWGTDGIRVNCIAPGLIKTEFSRALWENEAILKNSVQGGALKRIGDPDEMAGAVVYFATPSSSFTTGQTLVLDGGGLA